MDVEATAQVVMDLPHEGVDLGTAMVAGYIGVQIEPDALDPILVRTVGRQKVEPDPAHGPQRRLNEPALVDDVVVEDHVDRSRPPIGTQQRLQELDEQPTRLADTIDIDELLTLGVIGTGQVALHVLARRDDEPLLAWQHPVGPDARVQMQVDLVGIDRHRTPTGIFGQPAQASQASSAPRGGPGTSDDRAGLTPAHFHRLEHSPSVSHGQDHPQDFGDDPREQLQGPGRAGEPEVARPLLENGADAGPDVLVDLGQAVVTISHAVEGAQPSSRAAE
jgi:hypothetical protein